MAEVAKFLSPSHPIRHLRKLETGKGLALGVPESLDRVGAIVEASASRDVLAKWVQSLRLHVTELTVLERDEARAGRILGLAEILGGVVLGGALD